MFTAPRYGAGMDGSVTMSLGADDGAAAPVAPCPGPAEAGRPAAGLRLLAGAGMAASAAWPPIAPGHDANVFAEPWLLGPGLRHCDAGRAVKVAQVCGHGGTPAGLVPLIALPKLGRLPLPTLATWSHPNSFLSAVSASAGQEQAMWQGVLAQAPSLFPASRALLADGLVEGSALHAGLIAAAAALGLPTMVEARTVRAMLATDLDADAYWDAAVRAKKRKELRRQWARLGEEGTLSVEQRDGGGDPSGWIAEFLTLEASGWKGANGSALASNADTRAFFSEAMAAGWAEGKVLLTALRIDGRAIAMLITLVSGRAGFSFKTAFDERFARFSPGVLLQRESLALLTSRKLAFIDSCAAEDHPMIDSLWRERRSIVSLSMPLPGTANRLLWQAAQTAAAAWRGVKARRTASKAPPIAREEDDA